MFINNALQVFWHLYVLLAISLSSVSALTRPSSYQRLISSDDNCALSLEITNIQSGVGPLFITLFDGPAGFPENPALAVLQHVIETPKAQESLHFAHVACGEMAVAVLQDENGDKQLNTNIVGYPNESIGLSGYSRLWFPRWSKAKFIITRSTTQKINML